MTIHSIHLETMSTSKNKQQQQQKLQQFFNTLHSYGQHGNGKFNENQVFNYTMITTMDTSNMNNVQTIDLIQSKAQSVLLLANPGNKLFAFGDNRYGQLGTGNLVSANKPMAVDMKTMAGKEIVAIDISFHSLALTRDNLIYAWVSLVCT